MSVEHPKVSRSHCTDDWMRIPGQDTTLSNLLLIVIGHEDIRVMPEQEQDFYGALRKHGVPSQFVICPRAGHFLDEPR